MPRTELLMFCAEDRSVPLVDWLDMLPKKVQAKCVGALRRLELLGHELCRPEADFLRDDILELRVAMHGVNYRMLYFFHGRNVVVVSHGLTKERIVPTGEIDRAVQRRRQYMANPELHTFRPEGI